LEVRERLAVPPHAQAGAATGIARLAGVSEALLLSTCNRTEVYWQGDQESCGRVRKWFDDQPAARDLALDAHLYLHEQMGAAVHAFRVAAGLDSMVLGEPQILGQVKLAVKTAQEAGTLGGPLDRLFQESFKVAKAVRSETALGETSVSMAAAALKLAEQVFGELADTRLLLIGAGEMVELTAVHFAAKKPRAIVIANRTLERGEALAARLGGSAIALTQLPERLHEFDIVVSCTAATLPLIGKGMVERALRQRRHKPMFMVDLAVPRDIEPEVEKLDDVFLYSLDTLGKIVAHNSGKRAEAAREGEAIVALRAREFMRWLDQRASVPAIQILRGRAEQYRAVELERAMKSLAKGAEPAAVLEQLARGLTNKFLHHPLAALKRTEGRERETLTSALERLYPDSPDQADGTDGPAPAPHAPKH
jgi:glutamyl-tRNA reductase